MTCLKLEFFKVISHFYSFVYFHTHEEALLTRNDLNMTFPYYLQVCFAKMKKDKVSNFLLET